MTASVHPPFETQAILDSMIDPFILLAGVRDADGTLVDLRYLEVNDAAVAYNRLSREEMVGARLLDLFPGQLDHGPLRQYFHTIESGEPTVLDDYAYGHEILGEERRYDIRATRCGDGIALTWRDTTDRHRAARAVAEREQQYRLLAENASDVVSLASDDGVIQWVSPSAVHTLGYPTDDLAGRQSADFIHPDDLPALQREMVSSRRTGQDLHLRYRWRLPDGAYRWLEASAHPIVDESTGELQAVVSLRNVDEQVRAETELAAGEEMFRLLAENSTDVVILTEADTTALWVSPSVTAMLGWQPEQLVGRRAGEFADPGDWSPGRDEGPRTQNDPQRLRLRCADGSTRWIEALNHALPGTSGRQVVRLRDIDEQVRAEEGMAASEEMFRLLAENSSDVVILRDEGLRILWASPSTAAILGIDAADVVGRSVTEFVDPEDVVEMTAQIETANATGVGLRYRVRVRTASGGYRWFDGRNRPLAAPDGQPRHWVVSLQDIDDQVRAEQELAASEGMFRLLAENSTDVIILAALPDMTAVWVSPSAERMLGWPPESVTGRSPAELIHPDDLPRVMTQYSETWEELDDLRQTYRIACGDGRYRWVEAVARIVGSADDGRVVVRLRDIDDLVRAEQDLSAAERTYRLLAENSTDVVLLTDARATVQWASASTEATLGWDADGLIGRPARDFIHPDDVARVMAEVARSNDTMTVLDIRVRWRRSDGSYRWMRGTGRPFVDESTHEMRRIVTLQDIDDQVRAETELAAREEHYRLLAENASDVVWQVSDDGFVEWTSPSITRVLGWTPDRVVGRRMADIIDPADRDAVTIDRLVAPSGHASEKQVRMLRPDGTSRWMAVEVHSVPTTEGVDRIVSLRDIEEEVSARRDLEFVLGHDQLTGLPTRDRVFDRLVAVQSLLPEDRVLAVLSIGIDGLREVNEALGHGSGDTVIRTVASRIAQAGVTADLLGRGTGDEFIVVVPDLASGPDAAEEADRVRRAIHGPIDVSGQRIEVTASIGIAVGDRHATRDDLVRESSMALRKAKEGGRDRCAFVDPTMAAEAERRLALETGIRSGLAAAEFVPWFQPVVSLADGSIRGYEALARWQHADGTMEPDDFIPVAARSSLISDIDLAMLDPVVEALSRLPEPRFVALNVTGQTLVRTAYADLVTAALAKHDVRPARLHLEITETMLLTLNPDLVRQMRALADLGCRWYVDDFGTGYSSISHLRDLPVSGLKLDKSFTRGIGSGEPTARQLADALIGLANGLGIDTVAEGVETEAEASYLRTLGWRHGQGWLYGKAAPLS